MLFNEWDIDLQEPSNSEGLCNIIEKKCQPEINASINKIEEYLTEKSNEEISAAILELVQLLHSKLQDEIQHVFLKESGLIYPGIKNATSKFFIEQKALDSIQHTQQVIVSLLLKLRQLLNNYFVQPDSSEEWKDCLHEFFQLESKIHRWIYIEQSLLYPSITHKLDSSK